MKIQLKQLSLTNFKGIRDLTIEVGQTTSIFGMNGTGKTSVFDAFLWLLFGKDSTDRKDFEIKTLGPDGKPYRRLDHEVSAVLIVDGEELNLRKLYKEKWTRKQGSEKPEFTGHQTEYFWNGTPCNEKEFNGKIAGLINEQQFKLLTNLAYFNTVLKWQDRRTYLLQLAGGISDAEFAKELNTEGQYDHLIKALTGKKTLDEYRRELAAKKKTIKEDMEGLPYRISEAKRSLPEEQDFSLLEQKAAELQEDIDQIDNLLQSKSAAEKQRQDTITGYVQKQGELRRKLTEREFELRNEGQEEVRKREDSIRDARSSVTNLQAEGRNIHRAYESASLNAKRLSDEQIRLKGEKDLLANKWVAINSEEFKFDPSSCECPTCKQQLPGTDVEQKKKQLEDNFNVDKSKRLQLINEKGQALKTDLERIEKEIEVAGAEMSNFFKQNEANEKALSTAQYSLQQLEEDHQRKLNSGIEEAAKKFAADPTANEIRAEINELQKLIDAPAPESNNAEAIERKRSLQSELTNLTTQLSRKDDREKIITRIEELEKQESDFAQSLVEVEGFEFSLQQFDRAKMDLLEKKINGKFKLVTFKLFEDQINGGQVPACVTLVNGVPYPDANTASKINASLDIIRVFSEFYDVQAPVFIDNRESVVNIIDTGMQIVNLIVSADHPKLTVAGQKEMEAVA